MDSIIISDLEVYTHIGVPEDERKSSQKILVTVQMDTNTKDTAASDNIEHAIDYALVAEQIQKLALTERKTIERFAEDIAHMVLTQFKPSSVTVTTKKYVLPDANHVAVTITRP
jgi:dihydroneopterin aldolase